MVCVRSVAAAYAGVAIICGSHLLLLEARGHVLLDASAIHPFVVIAST